MTDLIEVKTADLEGAALDWAVAQVCGVNTIMLSVRDDEQKKPFALFGSLALEVGAAQENSYAPSSCWHCAGPLIDEHGVEFEWVTDATLRAKLPICGSSAFGGGHLIAACRAIVAAKLGDTVQVPKELMP